MRYIDKRTIMAKNDEPPIIKYILPSKIATTIITKAGK
jgi:hypothetical protein